MTKEQDLAEQLENREADIKLNENRMFGLAPEDYDKKATSYSKGAITIWLIAGLGYNLATSNLISVASLLLVLPGTLIVSLASIPFFALSVKKKRVIGIMDQNASSALFFGRKRPSLKQQIPTMILFTFITIIEWLFPIAAAILAMYLLNN